MWVKESRCQSARPVSGPQLLSSRHVMLNRLRLFAFAVLLVSFAIFVAAQEVTVDSDTFSGLSARPIGPAAMGGRIADIVAVQEGPRLTIYIGSASGGVWKSSDGGTTFKPVFDKQSALSIGSLAIDPSNPQTVWVGTGEAWVRNSVSVGTGIYRSRDGGDNWENLGLSRFRAPQSHRHSPQRQQHRLCLRPRASLEFQPGAWRLQDH